MTQVRKLLQKDKFILPVASEQPDNTPCAFIATACSERLLSGCIHL